MRYALHYLAYLITRTPRRIVEAGVDFEWSNKLWVHNVFRVFELIFGAPYGIRPSVSSWKKDGRDYQVGYTLEAQLAILESYVRGLFKKLSPKLVLVPQMQLAGMRQRGISPYMFAIAFDASSNPPTSSNFNLTHVVTGSNPFLFVFQIGNTGTDPGPSATYNSVSMTKQDAIQYPSDRWTYDYTLGNPSTGSNTVTVTGGTFCEMGANSYTGCQSSSTPDSHNTSNATTATWTISTTVVASNCWIVAGVYGMDPGPYGLTSGSIRAHTDAVAIETGDSNATVGTGSQTLSFTGNTGGRTAVGSIVSIAPAASAIPSQNSDIIFFN